ncbi:hypothetical protein GCM10027273_19180 [Nocardioides pakistanensis]
MVRRRFGRPPRRWQTAPHDAIDVTLAGPNGRTLRGWLFPAEEIRSPAVVVMHGWGASAADMTPVARMLAAEGFSTLAVDARCHGRSDDDDFASMPRFGEDVEAAVAWLRDQAYVDPRRIALLGHSVGAGACLLAASRDPGIAGVVSVSSMAHPGRFMQAALAGRGLPSLLARVALRYVEAVVGHRYDDFAPVRSIASTRAPVLLVHGDADTTVPLSDAHLLRAASGTAAGLVVVPDAGHDDLDALRSVTPEVLGFLRAVTSVPLAGRPPLPPRV